MVALHHRDRTSGRGQHIDLSLLDAAISATTIAMSNHFATGERFQRNGNEQATVVPSQVLRCADGEILISAPIDGIFSRLCDALGCPQLTADVRFSSAGARVRNRPALSAVLGEIVARNSRSSLLQVLEAHSVPAAPVHEMDEVFSDPQVRHRGNDIEVPHPVLGKIRIGTNPVRLSETPVQDYAPPPMLGEHTDWVLSNVLGLSETEVQRLRKARVL